MGTDDAELFIRRWIARDSKLLDVHGYVIALPAPSLSRAPSGEPCCRI
jgi:hypothetical protein